MSEQLARARIRLSMGYVAVAGAILVLFGTAIWITTALEVSRQLDRSLTDQAEVVAQMLSAVESTEVEQSRLPDAPGRETFLFDLDGEALTAATPEPWVVELARRAANGGPTFVTYELDEDLPDPEEDEWRMFGRRIRLGDGTERVAVVVADMIEADDLYGSLLTWLISAGVLALGLTGLAGWTLSGWSLRPAEQAFASLRRFTADAAHELRTPVAVIRTESELALESPRSPQEYQTALEGIQAESTRMTGLVDRLLTLARADAGAAQIEVESVYLDDILSDVAGQLGRRAGRRQVELALDLTDECLVHGDPVLLRELVLILADNAIRASTEGDRVTMAATVRAGHPELEVRDQGPGIAPGDQTLVFERFYRGDASRERGGVGLGLSIAKWITDAHGARIELESEVGQGTAVRVRFPAEPSTDGQP